MLIHTMKQALQKITLSLTLHWLDLISRLVCALIQVHSVNLKKLACSLCGSAQVKSPYRQLQQFFSNSLSPGLFTQLILARLVQPSQSVLLALNQTHWKLGRTDLNILCLSLVHQEVSIFLGISSFRQAG